MERRLILSDPLLSISIHRLCQQLIENHQDFANSVIIGLQPRGVILAKRMHQILESIVAKTIPFGVLDATFFRDDFRRREPLQPNTTNIPILLEGKNVILIDDVISTARMVRAAMDAMLHHGRPDKLELCVLVDRIYNRDLPIQPNYVGMRVNTLDSQKVQVEWQEQAFEKDQIWLIS
jgi:pyrimidine operon attenuation protein / uracil phosphoribosyltransferase